MAYLKFIFVFVCFLLVSQIAATPYVENVQEDQNAQELAEFIEKVTGFLKKVLDDSDKFVSSLIKDDIKSFQKATVDETIKFFGTIKKYLDELLDAISPQLNADAKKISKCIEDNAQPIIDILIDYYNKTTVCFNPTLKTTLVTVKPLIADLTKVDDEAAALAPEVKKCENEICVLEITTKLIANIASIEGILKKDLPLIEKEARILLKVGEDCATKEAEPWKKNAATLFNKVSTCIRS